MPNSPAARIIRCTFDPPPANCCHRRRFGRLIGRPRQGYAIVAVMAIIFLGHTVISMQAEARGNHLLPATVSQVASRSNPGGNM